MSRRIDAEPVGVPLGGRRPEVVLVGASTGGPKAVERILAHLPASLPAAIAVCQHMPPGFTKLWAERLNDSCGVSVCEARHGQVLEPGTAYVAPIGRHMQFLRENGTTTALLHRDFADSLHIPSIDIFMSSGAQILGSRALGVLLTGLGSDGALGMLALRRAGGYTICQSEESCVAPSMPSSAKELGAVAEEVDIDEMAGVIAARVQGSIQ